VLRKCKQTLLDLTLFFYRNLKQNYIFPALFFSVTQTESLFIARIRNEILKVEFFYCSCIEEEFQNAGVTEKADCSWRESLPECQPLNWGQKHCQIKGKREAEDDIEIDIPEDIVGFKESTLNVGWRSNYQEGLGFH
jgi:hypothetical protein